MLLTNVQLEYIRERANRDYSAPGSHKLDGVNVNRQHIMMNDINHLLAHIDELEKIHA